MLSMENSKSNACSICNRTHVRIVKSVQRCTACYAREKRSNCKIESCTLKEFRKGFCSNHFKDAIELGEIELRIVKDQCSVEGCNGKHQAKGYCVKHYKRFLRGSELKSDASNNTKACLEKIETTIQNGGVLSRYQKKKLRDETEKKSLRSEYLRNPIGKINDNVKFYRFDANELSKLAQIPIGLFAELLNHLKEDEQILDFTYDKKLMVVEIKIPNDIELNFAVNLNQKPDDVLF